MSIFLKNEPEVQKDIDDFARLLLGLLDEALEAGSDLALEVMVATGPGDGVTSATVERSETMAIAHLGPDKDHWYYRFFETGVQPHLVKAVNAKALRLATGDIVAAATPAGFPARPFLRTLFKSNKRPIEGAFRQVYKGRI